MTEGSGERQVALSSDLSHLRHWLWAAIEKLDELVALSADLQAQLAASQGMLERSPENERRASRRAAAAHFALVAARQAVKVCGEAGVEVPAGLKRDIVDLRNIAEHWESEGRSARTFAQRHPGQRPSSMDLGPSRVELGGVLDSETLRRDLVELARRAQIDLGGVVGPWWSPGPFPR